MIDILHYEYILARGEGHQWRVADDRDSVVCDFGTEQEAATFVNHANRGWVRSHLNRGNPWKYGFLFANPIPTLHDINTLAVAQYDWIVRMGWNNNTVLEDLALVASEVGEAVNECRGHTPTAEFKTELADIVLRVMGVAEKNGINLGEAIAAKMAMNEIRGNRGRVK